MERGTQRALNPVHLGLPWTPSARGAPRALGKLASVLPWDRLPGDCGPGQARSLATELHQHSEMLLLTGLLVVSGTLFGQH